MTKRQRAQVVELLRCAADRSSLADAGYSMGHCDGIHPCARVYAFAARAYETLPDIIHGGGWYSYPEALLEAAACVEEGSWP